MGRPLYILKFTATPLQWACVVWAECSGDISCGRWGPGPIEEVRKIFTATDRRAERAIEQAMCRPFTPWEIRKLRLEKSLKLWAFRVEHYTPLPEDDEQRKYWLAGSIEALAKTKAELEAHLASEPSGEHGRSNH